MAFLALCYMYWRFFLAVLMFAWVAVGLKGWAFTRSVVFRHMPIVFAAAMFGALGLGNPIRIVTPAAHTVVHAGDKITVVVEIKPAMIAQMFPFLELDVRQCYTCLGSLPGALIESVATGVPHTYGFALTIPKQQKAGNIPVAVEGRRYFGDSLTALRSDYIELNVVE